MGSELIGTDRIKIEPAHALSVPSIFNYFYDGADKRRWKKVRSDPILCLFSWVGTTFKYLNVIIL